VGGVEVCVDKPIDDEYTNLKLPAGRSTVEDEQALAFLRSRHGFGDGSDIGRIQAQQGFMAALLRKVKAEGTLSNPSRMVNIAEAITQNVTVDKGLGNINELVGIGGTLGGVDLSQVVFATVPTEPWSQDNNRLQVTSEADSVFKRLQDDQSLKVEKAAPAAQEQPKAQSAPADHSTNVTVVNATNLEGRGAAISQVVSGLGYTNVAPTSAAEAAQFSAVTYAAGHEAEAREIAAKLNIGRVSESAEATGVTVTVGTDFPKGETMEKQEAQIAGNANGQTADQETCQHAFAFNSRAGANTPERVEKLGDAY